MIFASVERGLHHAVEPCARKIAGVSAGRALPKEHAHADRLRAGLFQGFDLAEAHERGEFVALAHDAFGSGRAAGHGAADDVLGDLAEIGFEFRVSSFELQLKAYIHYPNKCG